MSGLFRRLSSRRSGGPEGDEPQTAAEPGATDAPATSPAEPEGRQSLLADPAAETRVMPGPTPIVPSAEPAPSPPVEEKPAAVAPTPPENPPAGDAPAPLPVADLPAGLDPDELNAVPATSARRGKLRRRIAFLRAAREVLLRDLGGFVYELHRTAHDLEHDAHRRLRETKLTRLERVDAELHDLEYRLDDVRRQVLVREPGVGGECPTCGELFGSAARYCWNCGLPLTESARRERARAQAPEPPPDPVVAPAPAPAPAAGAADQPTQEISPLDPEHPSAGAEFKWPRRDAATGTWTSEPAGAAGEARDAAAAAGEARADEAAPGETGAHGGEAAPGETASGETAAAESAAPGDTALGEPAPAGDAATGDAAKPAGDAASGEPAAGDGDDAAAARDDAPAGDAASGEPAAGDGDPAEPRDDAPAGDSPQNGTVFSPVERRP